MLSTSVRILLWQTHQADAFGALTVNTAMFHFCDTFSHCLFVVRLWLECFDMNKYARLLVDGNDSESH